MGHDGAIRPDGEERDHAARDRRAGPPGDEAATARGVTLATRLARAVDCGDPSVERLIRVGDSVSFIVDGGDPGATLLLDRLPIGVLPTAEPASIEVQFSAEQARRFGRGDLPLPAALAYGTVRTAGEIRRYLEVDVMLRRLLKAADTEPPSVPGSPPPRAEPTESAANTLAIETRGLRKSFGSQEILRGVDLAIPEGVIAVILGPSGTGKSVLLQHIIGLLAPDAGSVLIRGRPLHKMKRREVLELRRDIGVMFQDGALFSTMDVFDNVAFPLRQHTDLDEAEIRVIVHSRLAEVGMLASAEHMPSQLSGGMRKRAGLARSLILEPGITLCDEPDSGLDPVRTALLGELLREQHACHGGTMIVVTHNIPLARLLGDHISVLWQGKILEAGMGEQLLSEPSDLLAQFLAGATEGPVSMDA